MRTTTARNNTMSTPWAASRNPSRLPGPRQTDAAPLRPTNTTVVSAPRQLLTAQPHPKYRLGPNHAVRVTRWERIGCDHGALESATLSVRQWPAGHVKPTGRASNTRGRG